MEFTWSTFPLSCLYDASSSQLSVLNEFANDFKDNKNMCYCYKIAAHIGAVGIPSLSSSAWVLGM